MTGEHQGRCLDGATADLQGHDVAGCDAQALGGPGAELGGVAPGELGGRVGQLEPVGGSQSIRASVPLSEMFGYATDLRSMTQGRATFSMQFDRYEEVPATIAEAIVGGDKTP